MRAPLPALTSLRLFAALYVFLSHLYFLKVTPNETVSTLYTRIFYEGYMGVTFFFALSGFILSYAHAGKTIDKSNYFGFMSSRIARIYPSHALMLLFYILVVTRPENGDYAKYLTNLLFNSTLTQAFSPDLKTYFSFNAPSWSLSVEMFFYLLFPLLIICKTRTLLIATGLGIVLKLVLAENIPESLHHYVMYILPPLRLADFTTGLLLFRLFNAVGPLEARQATVLQAASLLLLSVFIFFSPSISQAHRFDIYYLAPLALIIFAFSQQQGALARAISNRPLVYLGQASFAFYLVHQCCIYAGQFIRQKLGVPPTLMVDLACSALYLSAALVGSMVVFNYFETPARLFTLRLLGKFNKRNMSGNSSTAS